MPVRLMKTKAAFEGAVSVEEADALQAWLIAGPSRRIDLARCTHLHPASLPEDAALAAWIAPLFPAN